MKIPKGVLCFFLAALFVLPFSACQRITDEVYEEGKVIVTLDESGLVQADEEGFLFVSDDKISTLSGSANTRAKVVDIQAEISCGNYHIETKKLKASQKWSYDNPPLLWGYNQIKIKVTADDGTTGEKTFAILSKHHQAAFETQTDSDGDGLLDYQEWIFGTDSGQSDTDGDGVGDYAELFFTRTNPTIADEELSNQDSVGDSLPDWKEAEQNFSEPIFADGKFDGRTDGSGVTQDRNTDESDSNRNSSAGERDMASQRDGMVTVTVDGAEDQFENYHTTVSAEITGDAEVVDSAHIRRMGVQNIFLNPSIPGYVASGYTLRMDGSADVQISVKCTGDDLEDPVLYLFNYQEQTLKNISGQRITADGTVKVKIEMPDNGVCTFILLNRAKASPYITTGKITGTPQPLDGYKNLVINGTLRLGTGARVVGLSADIADSDGDGLEDSDEAEIRVAGGKKFVYLHSDPTLPDSDFDGIEDGKDKQPLSYNISDRSMALACAVGYCDLSDYVGMTIGEIAETETGAAALGYLAGSEEINLLREAEVLSQTNNETKEETTRQSVKFDFMSGRYVSAAAMNEKGYGSLALCFSGFEKEGAIVFAVRGTAHDQSEIAGELIDRAVYMDMNTMPTERALAEYTMLSQYAGCGMYVTAHSTGGSVATEVLAHVYSDETKLPVRAATFNAIGSYRINKLSIPLVRKLRALNTIVNYYYYGDILGEHVGKTDMFARLGGSKGYTPMDRDGKTLNTGNSASSAYHDIKYFCTDQQLINN